MEKVYVFILTLLFSTVLAAGAYKWIDADGQVHFSDSPPDDQPCEEIWIRPSPPSMTEDRTETPMTDGVEETANELSTTVDTGPSASADGAMPPDLKDDTRTLPFGGVSCLSSPEALLKEDGETSEGSPRHIRSNLAAQAHGQGDRADRKYTAPAR